MNDGVLILSQEAIAKLATPIDYIRAVEAAFVALAAGEVESMPVGHVPGRGGGFHIKAAVAHGEQSLVVIKVNGNFPGNPVLNGLPTIQGALLLSDAGNGRLLAVMDTSEITARRTAAASAVAAKHLARRDAATLAFIGCGLQARHHLDALLALGTFPFRTLRCFDLDRHRMEALRVRAEAAGLGVVGADSVAAACRGADVIVTCTPSSAPVLAAGDVGAGAFIAAVGADNPGKCEIAPALMARSRVVADIVAQSIAMGDTRAAIAAGLMQADGCHAELAQIVSGSRPGRTRDDEVFVFDSTGTAIQDLAAAVMIYERAREMPGALRVELNGVGVG